METLFKIRLNIANSKDIKSIKVKDLDEAKNLHSIIITASPVLAHEIQKFYKVVIGSMNEEIRLKKHKKRVKKRKMYKNQIKELKKLKKSLKQSIETGQIPLEQDKIDFDKQI